VRALEIMLYYNVVEPAQAVAWIIPTCWEDDRFCPTAFYAHWHYLPAGRKSEWVTWRFCRWFLYILSAR